MCELEILLAKEQKNVLIVDAHYFDDLRVNSPNPNKVTQSMATVYLAGAFSRKSCEVKIVNKHYGGLAEDRTLPGRSGIFVLIDRTLAFIRKWPSAAIVNKNISESYFGCG